MERERRRESPTKRLCSNLSLLVRQFLLILGKNFLLQIRRPIGTVFEVVLPIVSIAVLVAFRFGIPSLGTTKECFQTFGSDPIIIPTVPAGTIYYAPNNTNQVRELTDVLANKLSQSGINLVGVATEEEFISLIADLPNSDGFCGSGVGIYFEDLNSSDIQYTIRMDPNNDWKTDKISSEFEVTGARDNTNHYFKAGFMQLEKVVDEAIIEWKTGTPFNVNVFVRQFPYPDYNKNYFLKVLETVLPIFFVFSLMYSVGVFVKELVLEKECRMKETMKMMGLGNWTLVSTWFIKQILFYLGPMIVMTMLLKFGRIYPLSNFFLLFIVLLFYYMTAVAFSFFISVWFSSARLGLFAGVILWSITYLPYFFLQLFYSSLSFGTKIGTSLISNVCLGYAIKVLTFLEVQEDGLQFSNIDTPLSTDDDLSMLWILFMMFVDIVFYMTFYWTFLCSGIVSIYSITIIIDAIKPGKYGTPKPFYFLFLPSFWCGNIGRRKVNPDDIKGFTNPAYDATAHEPEPVNSEVGIAIDRLTKIFNRLSYRKRKVAVDNLSLNVYKGQITALLGHNGAGKTTTMSILTGLFTPTTGNAYINGYSVQTEMDMIRRSLGICPQHNVLFDRLSVYEHLTFFSMLKGMPTSKVKTEVNQMIADLQLTDKRNIQAKKLSGGMKRKLSVGIALVGQSEIVILDEPTSGMDPYARRATWDLLLKYKEGRTMLLTTHFMDEADLLGDRIAIMAEGRLKCSGSSLFLKSRFGVGYHMTVVKEPDCNSRKIIDIVKGTVIGSSEVTDVGAELSFILPSQSKQQFPDLFDVLEKEKVELGISSFGVSITTMEEVFIKVGHGDEVTLESRLLRSQSGVDQSTSDGMELSRGAINTAPNDDTDKGSPDSNRVALEEESEFLLQEFADDVNIKLVGDRHGTFKSPSYKPNTGLVLWFQQTYAVFRKHLYHAIRFWASIIWQLIIPLFFVVAGLVLVLVHPGDDNGNNPSRVLSLHNSAPAKTIDFFWANLGGVSSPLTIEPNDGRSFGISSFSNFTDDIDQIKQKVSNYTSIDQCCDYQYQVLDKFCASRTVSDYYDQCKDHSSFSFKTCADCLSCSTYSLNRYFTCTNPSSHNDYGADCPISPPISYADLQNGDLTGPLDDYDTYVAEKLLDISGSYLNPNSFFRRYQGGFVVHPETYTYSMCTCPESTESAVCTILSPTLKYNYPSDNVTEFTKKSIKYLDNDISCSGVFTTTNADCSSDDGWNHEYNWAVENCINDLANRQSCSSCYDPNGCNQYVGSVAETFSTSDQPKITIWYNNQPYHMAAAVLNSFYSIYLSKQSSTAGNTITVTNKPLPETPDEQIDDSIDGFFGYLISYIAVFGTCFLFSSFVITLIQEKESKAKHIQFVSGVGTSSYWIGTFLFDILNVLLPVILTVVIFAAFNVEGFKKDNLAAIFILFFLSTWAAIPICYIVSFLFTNSLIAFAFLIMFHYFVFVVLQTTIFLVAENHQKTLYYIFLLHPTFGLGSGLTDMYNNQLIKDTCTKNPTFEERCIENGYTYLDNIFSFERPGLNYTFVYLFIEGIVFFILTLLIERQFLIPEIRRLIKYLFCRHKEYHYVVQQGENSLQDDDVVAETNRVHAIEQFTDEEVVVIKDLGKVYKGFFPFLCPCVPYCRNKCKQAVNGINLAIPTGECFGLLGVNGAGKTTTFNILTGDISATNGSATIAGYDISTQLHEVQKRIGYCPQFDAIIDLLTGRELLTMFARLRGIPEKHIKNAVQFEIERLDLVKHANKRCGNYSGGNKRKLSTAIALIGNPPILFLDEPTTGMDPVTRRFLWDALINIVQEGRSVVLTSHSMEECEALCSRLAIMVNGQFKCLGSIQHLKSKYGSGFTMELRVSQQNEVQAEDNQLPGIQGATAQLPSPNGTYAIKAFVATEFPGSLLLEEHQDSVTYRIPSEGASWSSMFRKIEDNKERFGIINYSVSQTTLDQVFINFAKEQEAGIN